MSGCTDTKDEARTLRAACWVAHPQASADRRMLYASDTEPVGTYDADADWALPADMIGEPI